MTGFDTTAARTRCEAATPFTDYVVCALAPDATAAYITQSRADCRAALAEVDRLRGELAVQADLSLTDLISRTFCSQAETAQSDGDEPWWAWSTDEIAELAAQAVSKSFAEARAEVDRLRGLVQQLGGAL